MFYAYYRTDTGRLISTGTQYRSDEELMALTLQWVEDGKFPGYDLETNPPVTTLIARKDYASKPVNGWDDATMDFTVLPPPPRADASTLFLRMTLNEHAQIIALARQNTTQGYKAQAWMDRMKHRATFDKDDTELVQGMTLLVQENVFTQARATEILGWS